MASSSSKSDHHHDQQQSEEESAKKKQNHDHQPISESMHTRYIAFVVLVIVVVMSAAMGTIWAVVKPKRPVYAIEYGVIKHGVITSDDKNLVASLSFVMRSYNPNNKATLYYESMNISNSYSIKDKSVVWSAKNVSQPPFNVTRINFVVPVQISIVYAHDSIKEYLQHGKIKVNITVTAEMRFGYGNWKSQLHPIWIYCQPAAVMLDKNFQTTDCYVDL